MLRPPRDDGAVGLQRSKATIISREDGGEARARWSVIYVTPRAIEPSAANAAKPRSRDDRCEACARRSADRPVQLPTRIRAVGRFAAKAPLVENSSVKPVPVGAPDVLPHAAIEPSARNAQRPVVEAIVVKPVPDGALPRRGTIPTRRSSRRPSTRQRRRLGKMVVKPVPDGAPAPPV